MEIQLNIVGIRFFAKNFTVYNYTYRRKKLLFFKRNKGSRLQYKGIISIGFVALAKMAAWQNQCNFARVTSSLAKYINIIRVHTGERAAILKLNFHEFDEKELLRAEFL